MQSYKISMGENEHIYHIFITPTSISNDEILGRSSIPYSDHLHQTSWKISSVYPSIKMAGPSFFLK